RSLSALRLRLLLLLAQVRLLRAQRCRLVRHCLQVIAAHFPAPHMERHVPLVRELNVPRAVPALANPCVRSSPRREEHSRRVLPEARVVRPLAPLNNAAVPCLRARPPAPAPRAAGACSPFPGKTSPRRPSLASHFTHAS